MKGCGHGSLDFHVFTKEPLTYKCSSPKVLRIGFDMEEEEEEVTRWALI